jgi:hypothetical protein
MEKLEFRLNRRLKSYLGIYGCLDQNLNQIITEALNAIESD